MVEITARYEGQLRCSATHGPSKSTILTDAPVDNHGKGEAFSPTDLVAAALPACMMTILGIYGERHGIDLAGMHARTVKEMSKTPPRRIAGLRTVITILEKFTYDRQFVTDDGKSVVLEFSAAVGDKALKGIDMIRFDDEGRIVEFEVMIRPFNALQALGAFAHEFHDVPGIDVDHVIVVFVGSEFIDRMPIVEIVA